MCCNGRKCSYPLVDEFPQAISGGVIHGAADDGSTKNESGVGGHALDEVVVDEAVRRTGVSSLRPHLLLSGRDEFLIEGLFEHVHK